MSGNSHKTWQQRREETLYLAHLSTVAGILIARLDPKMADAVLAEKWAKPK